MKAELMEIGTKAKEAAGKMALLETNKKNEVLNCVAKNLIKDAKTLIAENAKDMETGKANGMPEGLLDRLLLTEKRIEQMAEGLEQVAALDDPIGEVLSMKKRPNGLRIGQKRVPLGVVGIIYEARPNVTADAFGLCFKTGNAVILKGGSDALHSNIAIVASIRRTLAECGVDENAIALIEDTSRETTTEFMKMNGYVDVLIPRGGAGLIRAVVENATVPVIETGTGNCHIYVDESANLDMAVNIIFNAKTQRIGVCNACESLVVHENIKDALLPKLAERLKEKNVEMRGDKASQDACSDIIPASDEDWGKEYLDYIISAKIVDSIQEAIDHINTYGSHHTDCILTEDSGAAEEFMMLVDSAGVYQNCSTRFADGYRYGFGAEVGISTGKLHARGPVGLEGLVSYKYKLFGNGHVVGDYASGKRMFHFKDL